MVKKKLVPPDGGWGWIVVLAYAITNLVAVPLMQNFGLIFKDTFVQMKLTAIDSGLIINTNAAFAMLMGLINGPLLKKFSYRKVSIVAGFIMFIGVTLTAFANSFTLLFITYSLITAIGMGMSMSSYPLALSTYFIKKREKATGIAFAITGIGSILMPLFISVLLTIYDVQGVVLILGGVLSHTIFAALLLHPVKWYMKEEIVEEKAEEEEAKFLVHEDDLGDKEVRTNGELPKAISFLSIDHDLDTQSIYGFETTMRSRSTSIVSHNHKTNGVTNRKFSVIDHPTQTEERKDKWWSSTPSIKFDVSNKIQEELLEPINNNTNIKEESQIYNTEMTIKETEKSFLKRFFLGIVDIFDLTLLNDPKYVNIMLGLSLAVFAELNFSLLTPFILADMSLSTSQIATFLSVLSLSDVIFRFLAPFIGDFVKQPPKIMYLFSLSLLVFTRFTLLWFRQFSHLIGVALGLGVAKGIRTVYWTLVIPAYVPLERLAAASGLQMMVNGVFILIGGPLLGVIRDLTGSYYRCIVVMNMMTLLTITMWTTEIVYEKVKSKNKAKIVDNSAA